MEESRTAWRLRINGLVQGVGYRAFVVAEARRLNLYGWVRNHTDGTVEAVVSGDKAELDKFIAACRRGPPGAEVQGIEIEPAEPPDETGFHQVPTV